MSDQALCPLLHRRDPEKPRYLNGASQICGGHVIAVSSQLRTLATFDADVDEAVNDTALGQSSSGGPISGSKERPLVINQAFTDHKILAAQQLASWVLLVAEERQTSVKKVQVRSGNIPVFCGFLQLHHEWSVCQEWAGDYAGEILDLGRRAYSLLHPSGVRRFTNDKLMRCVEVNEENARCEGNLWALLTPDDPYAEAASELVCDLCGTSIPSADWLDHGRRVRRMQEAAALGHVA